jgi:hypothetical protein
MSKRRVNVNIDAELHDRIKAVGDELPGFSFSALVNESLEQALPMLEGLVEAAKGGDVEALTAIMNNSVMSQLVQFHVAMKGAKQLKKE